MDFRVWCEGCGPLFMGFSSCGVGRTPTSRIEVDYPKNCIPKKDRSRLDEPLTRVQGGGKWCVTPRTAYSIHSRSPSPMSYIPSSRRRPPERCPCGEPLHYPDRESAARIARMIRRYGRTVPCVCACTTWFVPRHYYALHGADQYEVNALGSRLGWKKHESSTARSHRRK